MKALEDAVFHQEKYPAAFYAKDTHSRCMLALGAVSHKLMKEGKAEKARKIINKIHANLGLHGQLIIHINSVILISVFNEILSLYLLKLSRKSS